MRLALTLLSLLALAPLARAEETAPHTVLAERADEGRHVVSVALPKRISEEHLTAISGELARVRHAEGRRTVIEYLVPVARDRRALWATATLDPGLTVRIHGLTLEAQRRLAAEAAADPREVVGTWLTSPPAAPGKLTLFKDQGRLFMEARLLDASRMVEEVGDKRTRTGRRLDVLRSSGDHYILKDTGEIELHGRGGLIATAERIAAAEAATEASPGEPRVQTAALAQASPAPSPTPKANAEPGARRPHKAERARTGKEAKATAPERDAVKTPPGKRRLAAKTSREASSSASTKASKGAKTATAPPPKEKARRKTATRSPS